MLRAGKPCVWSARHRIPKKGKTEAQTYRRLLERFDAFSNAAVDLQLEIPFQ